MDTLNNLSGTGFLHIKNGDYLLSWRQPGFEKEKTLTLGDKKIAKDIALVRFGAMLATGGLSELGLLLTCASIKAYKIFVVIKNNTTTTSDKTVKQSSSVIFIGYKKTDPKNSSHKNALRSNKEVLGRGAYGKVKVSKENADIAIKKDQFRNQEKFLVNEYKIGQKLKGVKGFVQVFNLYRKEYPDGKFKFKLRMERVHGVTVLMKYYNKLGKTDFIKISAQLIDCFEELVKRNIIVGSDFHTNNVMIENDTNDVKLIDYGLYKESNNKTDVVHTNVNLLLDFLDAVAKYSVTDGEEVKQISGELRKAAFEIIGQVNDPEEAFKQISATYKEILQKHQSN